jgi:hypothetical protein
VRLFDLFCRCVFCYVVHRKLDASHRLHNSDTVCAGKPRKLTEDGVMTSYDMMQTELEAHREDGLMISLAMTVGDLTVLFSSPVISHRTSFHTHTHTHTHHTRTHTHTRARARTQPPLPISTTAFASVTTTKLFTTYEPAWLGLIRTRWRSPFPLARCGILASPCWAWRCRSAPLS